MCICIENCVGIDEPNNADDVEMIQALLNANRFRLPGIEHIQENGRCGDKTKGALQCFIARHMEFCLANPDVFNVCPGSSVLSELKKGISMSEGTDVYFQRSLAVAFDHVLNRFDPDRLTPLLPYLVRDVAKLGIDTPLRKAHFFAQVGHETARLAQIEEITDGEGYQGILGNDYPGDGPRFKGRGLLHLTGRNNYKWYSNDRWGNDYYVDHPDEVASNPEIAVDVGLWFWNQNNLSELADKDDIVGITRKINGTKLLGLEERKAFLRRAKCAFC